MAKSFVTPVDIRSYIDLRAVTAPGTPPSGRRRLFTDVSDGQLKVIDSTGTLVPLENLLSAQAEIFMPKTADESVNNSTTLQIDNELVVPLDASGIWVVAGMFRIVVTGATMQFKYGFTAPAGGNFYFQQQGGFGTPSALLLHSTPAVSAIPGTSANGYGQIFRGWYVGGGTAGDLSLQWAQNVQVDSAPGVTLKAGSFIQATKVV